ncbi:MAG: hypothetical protein HFJ86_03205 [Oscillospiraceae bacterium]|nr:hypothetical protein [Oscillospiraceae bacterium]
MDGDPESSYAHYCLQKFGWEPSKFLGLPVRERAFVIGSIRVRVEDERRQEEEAKRKAKERGRR